MASRVAYTLAVGPIPDDLTIDHLCRNPTCCNPAHLEPVTWSENVQRAKAAITHCKYGHEFNPENTILARDGHRNCRICVRRLGREIKRRSRGQKPRDWKGTYPMTDNPFVYDGKPLATIGELLDAAYVIYKSGDQAEGQRFMAAYRAHTEHADVNIGYLAGYTGDMVEMLAFFDTSHPIFGRTSPTPDEAFAAGQRIGMERGSGA